MGHDVKYVVEFAPSAKDTTVLALAWQEGRVLLTNDLDFGDLVVRQQQSAVGVLLLRVPPMAPARLVGLFGRIWAKVEGHLIGHLVVATEERIRIRRL